MEKIYPKILLAICVSLFTAHFTAGQTGTAGQPGEFLRYGVGARAMGMGHAFTALANDASAIYWNPSGLISVPRKEFTTMYSNLFYDSRYTYMAAALPRTLVGEHNAVGLGWVNLTMAGFDQRDQANNPLGTFDIYEQAFMLSGAREFVSSWGILNYGANVKLVNQAFPGYTSEQGWGIGLDVGATFRPINMPVLKIFSLRYLMPLQLGVSLQNIGGYPAVGIGGGNKDRYPFIFRWGASYELFISDWRINLLYDQESFSGRDTGHYAGVETAIPLDFADALPKLRFGWNSRTNKPSFGGGFQFGYADMAAIQIDFAYELKPYDALSNDFRLFFTVEFGQSYDGGYFADKADQQQTEREIRNNHLQVVARYPNDNVRASAEVLGSTYDTPNAVRYYRLVGGLRLANEYFAQAKQEMRENDINQAKSTARKAVSEYISVFNKSIDDFTDTDLMNFGECLMMLERYSMASDTVLTQIDEFSLRYHYLMGTCYRFQDKWDLSIQHYNICLRFQEQKSMRKISRYFLAKSYINLQMYNEAISTLKNTDEKWYIELQKDYPRYPIINDMYLFDDVLFTLGNAYEELGKKENALKQYLKIKRFGQRLDYSENKIVDEKIELLLDYFSKQEGGNND